MRRTTHRSITFALVLSLAGFARPLHASFTSCATSWNNFNNPGFLTEYTYLGQIIADEETSADSSHGPAAVTPSWTDLASGSPGAFPGPEATSFFGYYDGGTVYDPDDPSTMEDDYIVFRMRVEGNPRTGPAFDSKHWNVLFDVDGDGYKEYWVDLDGAFASGQQPDRLQILYDNANRQDISDPDAARVEQFTAWHSPDGDASCTGGSPGLSHTRTTQVNDGTPDWWIEFQVPMTAFNDLNGNQVLFPDSPVAFVFSTGASNQDPLQKDFMQDLNFLTLADPITFGDVVTPSGTPRIEFTDSGLNPVDFYSIGDDVYVYLTDPASNDDPNVVECVVVTVTDPSTGDDEAVTLCESGPSTGIFTNRGGACKPTITNPSPAPSPPTAWVVGLQTSAATLTEDWTLSYVSATNDWIVTGSVSGTLAARAAHGVPYAAASGGISFTLYQNGPANGTVISFCTFAADPLATSSTGGADDDGTLEVDSGDDIYVSFTNPSFITVTDAAAILGPCDAFVTFTRASGLPATSFQLTSDPATSDQLYVTVSHPEANTNPSTAQTITVTLTGNDTQSLTLTETGPNTGEFRNTTGLQTKIDDGVVTPNDNLWEDVDTGVVTVTYAYNCGGSPHTATSQASLFYTLAAGGGRVYFTNAAGTQDVDLYGANLPVWIKVTDPNACAVSGTLQVTITSPAGDSETITLYQTFPGSGVYMNRRSDLVTTAGSAVVTSASATFVTDGIQPGDTFAIGTGPDLRTYVVASVGSQTQLTLTTTLTASRTGIVYSATPLMTATSDGAITADDDRLEADHDDTLTVSYDDCNDGDTDGSNDVKVDTALYNAPSLIINEVLFYPDTAASSCQTEAVELYNNSSVPITATGYTITDEDGFSYTIPQLSGSNIVLQPGETIYLSLWNAGPPNDFFLNGTYYLFTVAGATYPSDRFADPATLDPADQISLFDSFGVIQDYVGWSSTLSPSIDFYSDDSPAVISGIWQDDSFKNSTGSALGSSMVRTIDGFDTNKTGDWDFASNNTCQIIATRAFVSSLRAFREGGRVIVEWETASQDGTVGFYLYRLDRGGQGYVQVTKELVPALLDSPQGATYRVMDPTARGESFTYVLMEVEATPRESGPFVHGPFDVRLERGFPSMTRRRRGATEEAIAHGGLVRSEASPALPRPLVKGPGLRPRAALKIAVDREGLHSLSVSDIAALFEASEADVRTWLAQGLLRLRNQGRTVPWTSDDGSDLRFWGLAPRSIYTRENIYWLDRAPGLRMESTATVSGTGNRMTPYFTETVHVEEDRFPATLVSSDPESDYWFWNYVSGGHPVYGKTKLEVRLEGLSTESERAELQVELFGATDATEGQKDDHHVKVLLNGSFVGESRFRGIGPHTFALAVDRSLLREGTNAVELQGALDSGIPFSIFYVDSLDVRYPRRYRASGSTFVFQAEGNESLTVSGFPEPPLTVLDVTDRERPKLVSGAAVERTGDGYTLRIRGASPEATYAAVSSGGVLAPPRAWMDEPTSLRSFSNAADYLVITPRELEAGAQKLARHRSASGLTPRVVLLEDVMDEFQHGLSSPDAIRRFLAHAYRRWSKPPRMVVLAGAGTLDYKDRYGLGGNLVPPLMVGTAHGLYASDNRFGDVDGDGWPELAVGRIPATTDSELEGYVSKLEAQELHGASLAEDGILFLADDDPWTGAAFDRHSESMAAAVPAIYGKERIYLTETSAAEARARLLSRLREGVAHLNYVGHGGLDRFADEALLQRSDVAHLGNGAKVPVVTGFSCTINRFELPGFQSLGEALTLEPGGGAAAVWAPSGLSLDFEAWRLGNEYFRAAFLDGDASLGEVILRAFAAYRSAGGDAHLPRVYNLMGDPAMPLK